MTGNDDHLFRMFAAFDVPDDVVALEVGELLWRENQSHSHRSLSDQLRNQICILCGDCGCRNFWRIICVICLSSMWKPIIGATDRTNQASDSALSRRCARAVTAINNCFAMRLTRAPFRGHSFA